MDSKSPHELTTTLHLESARSASAPEANSSALLEQIISEAPPESAAVLRQIIDGDGSAAMIYIYRGPSQGSRFLISAAGTSIGRAPSNEIFLDDVTVSRAHAKIESISGEFKFTDLGSLNGSYINGEQRSSHQLRSGDEIQIGKFHMLFISAVKADSAQVSVQPGEK
jgi:pSer/pThr/pTyr-binding forkhead associated (FHA) protein